MPSLISFVLSIEGWKLLRVIWNWSEK